MSLVGRYTVDTWKRIDDQWIESRSSERFDWRPLIALIAISVALTIWYYYGNVTAFVQYFPGRWRSPTGLMQSHWWTTGVYLVSLVAVPMLSVALMPGERVADYAVAAGRIFRRMWLYLLTIAIALPALLLATDNQGAIQLYPFDVFAQAEPVGKLDWLALTALQVLAIEFFFRCFLLRALAPRIGSAAIFVMVVPYSMVLHGLPMVEFAAAILLAMAFAGRILLDPKLLGRRKAAKGKQAELAPAAAPGFLRRWLHLLTIGSWRQIDEDWVEPHAGRAFDWRPLIVLATVAVSLMLQETYGDRTTFAQLFPERMASEYGVLQSFAWWSGWRFLGYVILPVMAIWLMPGERIRDYFISFKDFLKHLWIYIGLFALVLPAVLIAAQSDSFLRTYPFYKLANRSAFDFWAWQALYAVQFLSLEFFFRGFILKAVAPRLGSAAIFVMVVPYCMIHFGKPMSETLGAIIAGTVLGTLALRTRSIWGGVLIHVGVAVTMDLLAVSQCPPADTGLQCPRH